MATPPSLLDKFNAWFARNPLVGAGVAAGVAAVAVHEIEKRRKPEEEDE